VLQGILTSLVDVFFERAVVIGGRIVTGKTFATFVQIRSVGAFVLTFEEYSFFSGITKNLLFSLNCVVFLLCVHGA